MSLLLSIIVILFKVLSFSKAEEELAECTVKSGIGEKYSYNKLTDKGPSHWGYMQGYELCGTGESQSPINFPLEVKLSELNEGPIPKMKEGYMHLIAKPDNWALKCEHSLECGYTTYKNDKYYVSNIHFHTPSEHLLNGKQFPIEAHIVHGSLSGNYIVIATMFDFPDNSSYASYMYQQKPKDFGTNPFLSVLWKNMFEENREKFIVPFGNIIDRESGICTYNGSLTTPPCSQNVIFLMQLKVQSISKVQAHRFYKSVNSPLFGINRPIQDLNGRQVTCYF